MSPNTSNRISFGIDNIPIFNRFKATPFGDAGDIKLIGTYLDYEGTTNGWHIDRNEEDNITKDEGLVTVRIAHSKDPKEVVGKYEKFWAAEDDGCTDAYGKPLGRHIDFEAVTNPQDPQLRTNILKGWVGDISPGLDAEVFCGECGEAWGLDEAANKLVKTCKHQDAEGVLRNIKKKEGSIVTEPAFKGRTHFRPSFTFSMAMNELFNSQNTVRKNLGGKRKLVTESEAEGDSDFGRIRAVLDSKLCDEDKRTVLRKILESESEGESEGAYPYTKGEGDTTPPETGDTPKVTPGSTRKERTPRGLPREIGDFRSGANVPPSEVQFGQSEILAKGELPTFSAQAKRRFDQAFASEFVPRFRARLNNEAQ